MCWLMKLIKVPMAGPELWWVGEERRRGEESEERVKEAKRSRGQRGGAGFGGKARVRRAMSDERRRRRESWFHRVRDGLAFIPAAVLNTPAVTTELNPTESHSIRGAHGSDTLRISA